MAGQRVEGLSSLPCPLSPATDCLCLPQGLGPTPRPSPFSTPSHELFHPKRKRRTQLPGPEVSKHKAASQIVSGTPDTNERQTGESHAVDSGVERGVSCS